MGRMNAQIEFNAGNIRIENENYVDLEVRLEKA